MSTRTFRLLFGAFVISLAACATPTPVSEVTPTATATRTRPPTETLTPRPTNTPLPPPTFTPATPVADASRYQLVAWDAERANEIIAQIRNYPNTQVNLSKASFYEVVYYYELFRFSVLAQLEALIRYPDVPQSENWRWNLGYDMAQAFHAHLKRQKLYSISDN
ncbi:MAG: hypothetical protein ACT4QE_08515 [Anaerolineales bacterium]